MPTAPEAPVGWREPRMLHVLNGDVVRETLEHAAVPGTLAVWADVLHEGPVPGEDVSSAERREVRARYLAQAGHATYGDALATLRGWDSGLDAAPDHDEVVIWCEHDLFDQLLLIRHLHHFSGRGLAGARLSLICIDRHPEVPHFMGLGQLSAEALAALLPTRRPVTAEQTALAGAAWRAFTAPDPMHLQSLMDGDSTALPWLEPALRRHLQEFPAVGSGLSRTERQILHAAAAAPRPIGELFREVQRAESVFFIGDTSFARVLRDLAAGPEPAIRLMGEGDGDGALPNGTVEITAAGRSFLRGEEDRVRLHGIDRWLGGAHLRPPVRWRWDDAADRLVRGHDA
jgi:hypothetical protein